LRYNGPMTELDPQAPGLVSFLLNDRFQIEHRTVLGDLQNGLKEMTVSAQPFRNSGLRWE